MKTVVENDLSLIDPINLKATSTHAQSTALIRKVCRLEKKHDRFVEKINAELENKLSHRKQLIDRQFEEEHASEDFASSRKLIKQQYLKEVDERIVAANQIAAERLYHQAKVDEYLPAWTRFLKEICDSVKAFGHANNRGWRSRTVGFINQCLDELVQDPHGLDTKLRLSSLKQNINTIPSNEVVRTIEAIKADYVLNLGDDDSLLCHHSRALRELDIDPIKTLVPMPAETWAREIKCSQATRDLRKPAPITIDLVATNRDPNTYATLKSSDIEVPRGDPNRLGSPLKKQTMFSIDASALPSIASTRGAVEAADKRPIGDIMNARVPSPSLDIPFPDGTSSSPQGKTGGTGSLSRKMQEDSFLFDYMVHETDVKRPKLSSEEFTIARGPIQLRLAAASGDLNKALQVFRKYYKSPKGSSKTELTKLVPTMETFHILMAACKNNKQPHQNVFESAYGVIDLLEQYKLKPDTSLFNIFIQSCENQSRWRRVLLIFKEMKRSHNLVPNGVSMQILLNCCRYAVDDPAVIYEVLRQHNLPKKFCYKAASCCAGNRISAEVIEDAIFRAQKAFPTVKKKSVDSEDDEDGDDGESSDDDGSVESKLDDETVGSSSSKSSTNVYDESYAQFLKGRGRRSETVPLGDIKKNKSSNRPSHATATATAKTTGNQSDDLSSRGSASTYVSSVGALSAQRRANRAKAQVPTMKKDPRFNEILQWKVVTELARDTLPAGSPAKQCMPFDHANISFQSKIFKSLPGVNGLISIHRKNKYANFLDDDDASASLQQSSSTLQDESKLIELFPPTVKEMVHQNIERNLADSGYLSQTVVTSSDLLLAKKTNRGSPSISSLNPSIRRPTSTHGSLTSTGQTRSSTVTDIARVQSYQNRKEKRIMVLDEQYLLQRSQSVDLTSPIQHSSSVTGAGHASPGTKPTGAGPASPGTKPTGAGPASPGTKAIGAGPASPGTKPTHTSKFGSSSSSASLSSALDAMDTLTVDEEEEVGEEAEAEEAEGKAGQTSPNRPKLVQSLESSGFFSDTKHFRTVRKNQRLVREVVQSKKPFSVRNQLPVQNDKVAAPAAILFHPLKLLT